MAPSEFSQFMLNNKNINKSSILRAGFQPASTTLRKSRPLKDRKQVRAQRGVSVCISARKQFVRGRGGRGLVRAATETESCKSVHICVRLPFPLRPCILQRCPPLQAGTCVNTHRVARPAWQVSRGEFVVCVIFGVSTGAGPDADI